MHANNKGGDLSSYMYPRSLISAFIVRLLECIISILARAIFQLVFVAEHTGLSLTQLETRKTCFLRDGLNLSYH